MLVERLNVLVGLKDPIASDGGDGWLSHTTRAAITGLRHRGAVRSKWEGCAPLRGRQRPEGASPMSQPRAATKNATSRGCGCLQFGEGADLDANARRLRGSLDHFAVSWVADKRSRFPRRHLAQADLQKTGQREFAYAAWVN